MSQERGYHLQRFKHAKKKKDPRTSQIKRGLLLLWLTEAPVRNACGHNALLRVNNGPILIKFYEIGAKALEKMSLYEL